MREKSVIAFYQAYVQAYVIFFCLNDFSQPYLTLSFARPFLACLLDLSLSLNKV